MSEYPTREQLAEMVADGRDLASKLFEDLDSAENADVLSRRVFVLTAAAIHILATDIVNVERNHKRPPAAQAADIAEWITKEYLHVREMELRGELDFVKPGETKCHGKNS